MWSPTWFQAVDSDFASWNSWKFGMCGGKWLMELIHWRLNGNSRLPAVWVVYQRVSRIWIRVLRDLGHWWCISGWSYRLGGKEMTWIGEGYHSMVLLGCHLRTRSSRRKWSFASNTKVSGLEVCLTHSQTYHTAMLGNSTLALLELGL